MPAFVSYQPARDGFIFGRAARPDTGTLPGLLGTLSARHLAYELWRRFFEEYCATKTDIVVRVRRIVVVAVRHTQVVFIIIPTAPAQHTNILATLLVT